MTSSDDSLITTVARKQCYFEVGCQPRVLAISAQFRALLRMLLATLRDPEKKRTGKLTCLNVGGGRWPKSFNHESSQVLFLLRAAGPRQPLFDSKREKFSVA